MPKLTEKYTKRIRCEKSSERFTLRGMIATEVYNIIHFERKRFFYTAYDLTVRPAKSIHRVIDGYRRFLYPHLDYLLLVGAITIFLSVRYKFFMNDYAMEESDNILSEIFIYLGYTKAFHSDFFNYAEKFATIVNILAIPVFAISSAIFFGIKKYNIAEHLILNVYICAQQLLFVWLLIPILEFDMRYKEAATGIYTFAVILYNCWVYFTFFEGKILMKGIKSMISVLTGYIVQMPVNLFFYILFRPFIDWLDAIF